MSLIFEQITQILEKVGISSSLEEEILTTTERLIIPLEENEESTFQESYTSDRENC